MVAMSRITAGTSCIDSAGHQMAILYFTGRQAIGHPTRTTSATVAFPSEASRSPADTTWISKFVEASPLGKLQHYLVFETTTSARALQIA